MKRLAYFLLVFFIGLVSAYDNICTWVFRNELQEENPLGVALIELDGGQVGVFMTIKACTTIVCVVMCFILVYTRFRVAVIITAIFQLCLLWYLNFSMIGETSKADEYDKPVYKHVLEHLEGRE
jgi:hypothetical protein